MAAPNQVAEDGGHLEIQEPPVPVVLVIGEISAGKSTFCNYLTGHSQDEEIFVTGKNENGDSKTKAVKITEGKWLGTGDKFVIIDTPGMGDTMGKDKDKENMREIVETLANEVNQIHAILLVINGIETRDIEHIQYNLKIFQFMFGDELMKTNFIIEVNSWNHYDDLNRERREDFINNSLGLIGYRDVKYIFIDPIAALPREIRNPKVRHYENNFDASKLQAKEQKSLKDYIWSKIPFSCKETCVYAESMFDSRPNPTIRSGDHVCNKEVVFGKNLELQCVISSLDVGSVERDNIVWLHNGSEIQISKKLKGFDIDIEIERFDVKGSKVEDFLYEARLSKTEVKWTDAGAYSCKYKKKKATHDFKVTLLPIIDCTWENWSDWSDCSKLWCSGLQTRRREIQVQPANGGKECNGDFKDVEVCNIDCPGKSMSIQ